MNESILNCIKKLLGIDSDVDHFDVDVITHINSAFSTLNQLGVGPSSGFSISDNSKTWDQFISSEDANFNLVKDYVFKKVKQSFDPPTSSIVSEALNRSIAELEWRLNCNYENNKET